ncbi:hypothetical protein UMM65_02240 [Aureibaculum sp. 2210JD6-5]|uniref:hypothetical protein n=1 Tax=Aureibaculum sp. 2210JD6-5 TaxID=3103957 RepID=UPI002AAEE323|nr:hypothetical protein [Aureibaculum sp. 2210JD6-5]MDY7394045.1 hypothetical protein [Aureibaculum sp. 2210JD6-5]
MKKKKITTKKNEADKNILFKHNGQLQRWLGKLSSLKHTHKKCEIVEIKALHKKIEL